MIQVTLNFPDQAALLAYFTGQVSAPAPTVTDVKVEAPKPVKAAKPAPTVPTPSTVEAAPVAVSEPKAESSEPVVDYPTLQKAVFALAGKNRDAVVAIAASFGAKTFKELDPSNWAAALNTVTAKLAELEAA